MNNILINTAIGGLIIMISACVEHPKKNIDDAIEIPESTTEIIVTTRQFEAASMALDSLKPHYFSATVTASGRLDVPPQNMVAISPYYGGYVKYIELLEGQKVAKGEILLALENPEYVQLQQDYLETKQQLEFLKSEYERQKVLSEENITAHKNFLKAKSDYLTNHAKYKGLKKRLELLNIDLAGVEEGGFTSVIYLFAPIDGKISRVNASRGTFLNPGDVAVEIINTAHIHLELEVFEKDILKLKEGQTIHFRLPNSGEESYEAVVHLVSGNIGEEKRAVKVHGHIKDEEKHNTFLPGMYAEAQIQLDYVEGIAVPKEAVVKADGESFLLVQKEHSKDQITLELVKVDIGREDEKFIEILNSHDLINGKLILTKGAFSLIGV